MRTYTIVFVGNPNVGKSTWINALSNSHFKVGNWPGVTIEKKEASIIWNNNLYNLVDLPGCYSLSGTRNEERITANYIKENQIDGIVNIVDSTNLNRNLVLTLILKELQIPMIIIFNFANHLNIQLKDITNLENKLQIPILIEDAFDQNGVQHVKECIVDMTSKVFYPPLLSKSLIRNGNHLLSQVDQNEKQYYEVIHQLIKDLNFDYSDRYRISNKIDDIVLHPIFGIFIFLVIMSYLVCLIFRVSSPWNEFISYFINHIIIKYVNYILVDLPDFFQHFILDGILAGVGGVLTFIPLMGVLYFVLTMLEESGYMARVAFLLDRLMDTFHLNGKSFVAFMLGFGCNVPGIYATRTLENEKQKKLTALLVPFMSCGARIPIYALFAQAFFSDKETYVVVILYGLGLLLALISACVISKFHQFCDDEMFVLELPPYRIPKLKLVLKKVGMEVKNYIYKAFSIIMLVMIVVWGFSYFPTKHLQTSYLAKGAKYIAPIFEPLGFGTRWECVASLPQGIIAKETIVASLDSLLIQGNKESQKNNSISEDMKEIIAHFRSACHRTIEGMIHVYQNNEYEIEDIQLINQIQGLWNDRYAKLRAFCFMVYVLLSMPCIMTLQAMYREYGFRFVTTSIGLMLIIAYVVSFFIFQIIHFFY